MRWVRLWREMCGTCTDVGLAFIKEVCVRVPWEDHASGVVSNLIIQVRGNVVE